MAAIAIQEAAGGVQSVNLAAAVGPDTVQAGIYAGGWELPTVLVVKNTDVAARTVTVDGVAFIVPATTGLAVIPIRRGYGAQLVTVTYSAVAGVTVGALRLSRSD